MLILETLNDIAQDFSSRSSEGDRPNTYHFVIPSADGRSFLPRRSGQKLRFPVMSPPRNETSIWIYNWDRDPDRVRTVVSTEMGIDAYVQRLL